MTKHKYEFRVIRDIADGDVVYVVQCHSGYTYGETYSSFGWCDATDEYELEDYFDKWYETKDAAIIAIKNFRGEDDVVWEEHQNEEEKEND